MAGSHELPRAGKLVVVADETSALGYRLTGLPVLVPHAGEVETVLEEALRGAALVLLTTGLVQELPARRMALLEQTLVPCVLVVPDLRNLHTMPDRGARVRAELAAEP